MKSLLRRMRVHLSLLALCVLLVPGTALAYWDVDSQLALADEDMPLIYGTLNQRMATRTGPSTDYPEPGTFLSKGKQVRIISVAFDANEVPWVQVELTYGKKHIRAYTGLKRFDQVDVNDIPREFNYDFEAILNQDVTPLYGPGTEYSALSLIHISPLAGSWRPALLLRAWAGKSRCSWRRRMRKAGGWAIAVETCACVCRAHSPVRSCACGLRKRIMGSCAGNWPAHESQGGFPRHRAKREERLNEKER